MIFKNMALTILLLAVVGCARNPIEKPHYSKEYQQPFAHAQYQTVAATATQLIVKNHSDVVDIVSEPEYVFWDGQESSLIIQPSLPVQDNVKDMNTKDSVADVIAKQTSTLPETPTQTNNESLGNVQQVKTENSNSVLTKSVPKTKQKTKEKTIEERSQEEVDCF